MLVTTTQRGVVKRIVAAASIAAILAFSGASTALAARGKVSPDSPNYVICSQQVYVVLTSNSYTYTGQPKYVITAEVGGFVDARYRSDYCGPLSGEGQIYEPAGATGGNLQVWLHFDGTYTYAQYNPTPNGGLYGNTPWKYTAYESPMCAYTAASFNAQSGQQLNTVTSTICP